MMKRIKIFFLVVLLTSLTACGGGGGGTPADGGGTPTDGGGQSSVKSLDFFEEQLARKWSRYHSYDGSYMYFVFKGDRTACYFEISSSGSRIKETKYIHWELKSMNGNTTDYDIVLTYSSGNTTSSNEFYYADMELWNGGYSNLRMYPSTTSRDCS